MAFPSGTPVVTLVGTLDSAVAGTGYGGQVVATPSAVLTDEARHAVYPGGGRVDIVDGAFTMQLIPNNAAGILPAGWMWHLDVQPSYGQRLTFWCNIQGADGDTIHLDDLLPEQAPGGGTISGGGSTPTGPAGGALDGTYPNPQLSSATVARFDTAGAASSAQTAAATDATTKVSAHATASDPHGDRAYAAALFATASGGGTSIRTATARITDDNLSGLPSAASWTIVQTSAGTKLQASIAAAAGDRIRASAAFMRSGSHFLDWALLDNTGAIAQYAGSGASSPLPEGNPAMYPSLSFDYVTGDEMFVVSSSHIDGSGKATVALVHQGTGAGTVYAHTTYPWRLRLENIGAEPA